MNNNYNYYPNVVNSRFDYNDFLNSMGLNANSNMNMNDMNIEINEGFIQNMNTNQNNNSNLYGSYEGYIKGNLFRNLYNKYKNYEPDKLTPNSQKDEDLLNLNQMQFAMHEANLYLDVYPNDSNMMKDFVRYRNEYNRLLNDYEKKYGALNINDSYLNSVPYGWEEQPFPWERRNI
ncbi:MAG: spore coat protein CotJB [bacterium]|nr:spore coat protein CotJB [bacterium]